MFYACMFQVTAIDRDIGKNGEVRYNMVQRPGEETKFRIDQKSGKIMVKRPLEFEDQNKEFTLTIEAVDRGR